MTETRTSPWADMTMTELLVEHSKLEKELGSNNVLVQKLALEIRKQQLTAVEAAKTKKKTRKKL